MSKKWYVVHAYSGYEKTCGAGALQERVERVQRRRILRRNPGAHEEVVEMRAGQKRKQRAQVLPRLRAGGDGAQRRNLAPGERNAPGHGLHRWQGGSAGAADRARSRCYSGSGRCRQRSKATPKTVFEPGEMVRVIDGPFNDFNGVVEEVNYEKSRLNVAVLHRFSGGQRRSELDFGQVEKAK